MSSNIEILTEKTEHLSIDPIYNTNWCDMPAEIKLECIGKMKFEERLSLRCTAKAERSLVDSQNIQFFWGHFYNDARHVWLTSNNDEEFSKRFRNPNNGGEFLKYIWKIGVFKTFFIGSCFPTAKETFLNYTGKISAERIELGSCDNEMVVDVLKKLKTAVESITIYCVETFDYNFDEILEISQVQSSKYWFIRKYHQTDILVKFAQMWIDKNSKIGSTLSGSVEINGSLDEFSNNFADRIVTIREKKVRIRTNNSDRHILLNSGINERIGRFMKLKFYHLSVISADMIETEF